MASRIGALLHRDPFSSATPADAPRGAAASPPADAAAAAAAVPAPGPPPARTVQMGDLVIVYEGFNKQKAVTLTEKGQYQNRYGSFPHRDWVGKPFGAKVYGKGEGKGFVWLLAPTPELWTKVLPHRTQILYAPDISLVAHALELKPGSVVLESGTGSASLTHALVRAVAPKGHVYTFEFNRARAEAANEEILQHGLASACTVSHRDVEKDGFPKCLENRCDAVFLDLPGPWKVIHSAAKSLRHDGVLCAFSPCIEQVQRTCEALEAHGFGDTQTVELLGRELDVETRDMQRSLKHAQPKLQNKWQREAKQKAKRKRAPGTGGGDGDGDGDGDDASELMRVVSYPRQQAQSHTGYLTFARLVPYATAEEAAAARAAGRAKRGRNGGGEENEDEFSE
jgi:tRNA (adenine57-N1/adenine58-N1)-methyltransferase